MALTKKSEVVAYWVDDAGKRYKDPQNYFISKLIKVFDSENASASYTGTAYTASHMVMHNVADVINVLVEYQELKNKGIIGGLPQE